MMSIMLRQLFVRSISLSLLFLISSVWQIPAANAIRVVDPTGCGDAYRAGLIYGLMNDMDLATTGRIPLPGQTPAATGPVVLDKPVRGRGRPRKMPTHALS